MKRPDIEHIRVRAEEGLPIATTDMLELLKYVESIEFRLTVVRNRLNQIRHLGNPNLPTPP